jgi:hypothetical protein
VPQALVPLIVPCLVRDPLHRPTPARLLATIDVPNLDDTWLPAPVRTLVEQRHTELQALPTPNGKPPTRLMVEESGKKVVQALLEKVAPKPAPVKVPAVRPAPKKPVGVTFKASRMAALAWAGLNGVIVLMALALADRDNPLPEDANFIAAIVAAFFTLTTVRLLIGALRPRLGLDIGPDGLAVSCGTQERRLPWYAISRVKVVVRRGKPWLVVWLVGAAGEPKTVGHGTFKPYKGGYRAFPVSHEKGAKGRAKDVTELRSALAWYASNTYDPR